MEDRFASAVARFDRAHRQDPRLRDGEAYSLHYHRRLLHWITALDPHASEPLRLVAHCQHIRRWALPRDRFPAGRAGYRRWRTTLAKQHADDAEAVLREVGYDEATITRVRELLLKKRLGADDDVQLLEDAVCLTFIENELSDFAVKHNDDKLVDILQKTWKKMSPRGHASARALAEHLPRGAQLLLERALG